MNMPISARQQFAADLHAALSSRPRNISPKYFYDEIGSRLFEQICELPEYYPTRTELALLQKYGREMAECIGPHAQLVEYGAGALRKVRLLLDHLREPEAFVPVDISGAHLLAASAELGRAYPGLKIAPLVADFTQPHDLPPRRESGRRVGFFPGSSIGNFTPAEARDFLRMAAQELRGGGLLIGIDRIKEPALLHAAYNDSAGVTAAFNLNLLERARRELGAEFDPDGFLHSAFYNAPLQRIEMHLQSRRAQTIRVGETSYDFAGGETLHTENSHKYSVDGFQALAAGCGFSAGPVWSDERDWFTLLWLQAPD